eukprot:TRINITY_DN168_c0_g1_i1.p1 TRINITY_DN168_c0_g1~~TRINITY_DN168_c0_g1_i1.p1  ORF type:complete len:711 (+),score=225.11 TRINITY_DN168_c0_g1_i1:214-2346(+)
MSGSKEEQERVAREQEFVKEKGHKLADKAHDVKEGKVDFDPNRLPSNESLTSGLQKGQESLERFQNSDRAAQAGGAADKVVEDVKKVLADNQAILEDKNAGDLLQNLVKHVFALLREMRQNGEYKELFDQWQSTITSVMSSGDINQFFSQAGDLFTSMKDTEEFLTLALELIDLAKVMIAEATEVATEHDEASLKEWDRMKEYERKKVIAELKATMKSLSRNDLWKVLVYRGRRIKAQAKEAGSTTTEYTKSAAYSLRESSQFKQVVEDFRVLLQRLVGDQLSVDPLFQHSQAAIADIREDDELSRIADEMQTLMDEVAENPSLIDDKSKQRKIDELTSRAQEELEKMKNNKHLMAAKEESRKVASAIKNEPATQTLLTDMKTLFNDVISDEGHALDPEVLKSLRGMIVPLLVEHLNNIPLPTITGHASFLGKYSYTIDNMKISLPELVPEGIHLRFEYEMDANPLNLETANQKTYLYIQANHIQVHVHDAHFAYERTTVPRMSDNGIADVDTTGAGMKVWMKVEIKTDKDKGQYIDVLKSDVQVEKFSIKFHDSKHDKLYEALTHVFQKKIKNGVLETIQEKLVGFGNYFNTQIMTLIEQARGRSSDLKALAQTRLTQAREGMQNMKINAHDAASGVAHSSTLQDTKDSAATNARGAVSTFNEKAQELLDEQKEKLERQKREKELDRAISEQTSVNASAQTKWEPAQHH